MRRGAKVLGVHIDALDWGDVIYRIEDWAARGESRSVAICNVHSVVTANRDPHFFNVLAGCDLATPDGAPIAWMLRRAGYKGQQRINGPDLMLKMCERAASSGLKIFLYGGSETCMQTLLTRLNKQYPTLNVAGYSPPYRALNSAEIAQDIQRINDFGSQIVFVGLGCPKQEQWMLEHREQLPAVTIGVGAAFDYHAGVIRRAPVWMQERGLEWLHRLLSEPKRLWRRYLVTNSYFILMAARQIILGRI